MDPEPDELLVWGAGGHGRVVADLARAAGFRVLGFIDRDRSKHGLPGPDGLPVSWLEADFLEAIRQAATGRNRLPAVGLGIGDNAARQRVLAAAGGLRLPPLRHPSAIVSPTAELGRAVTLMAGAVVNPGAGVGAGAVINTRAVVEHDCRIGSAAHVAPGAVLGGGVTVGELTWIGAGAIVLPGVAVGAGSIVGAGAVVLRDIPPGVVVVGNPARLLRRVES